MSEQFRDQYVPLYVPCEADALGELPSIKDIASSVSGMRQTREKAIQENLALDVYVLEQARRRRTMENKEEIIPIEQSAPIIEQQSLPQHALRRRGVLSLLGRLAAH